MRTSEEVPRSYGLLGAPTQEDYPELWAAVLIEPWPAPDDPDLDMVGLSFEVGGSYTARAIDPPASNGVALQPRWCHRSRRSPLRLSVPYLTGMALQRGSRTPVN
jgi:hypothetical protein